MLLATALAQIKYLLIKAQIKYLQDESLSMNVKLCNRLAAESQISGFIQQIVVPPDLISAICEGDVNEACALPPPPLPLPHIGRWPSPVPCRTLLPARSRDRSGPCGRTSSSASRRSLRATAPAALEYVVELNKKEGDPLEARLGRDVVCVRRHLSRAGEVAAEVSAEDPRFPAAASTRSRRR